MQDSDLKRILAKIRQKQFRFLAAGENGRVYEVDDEDVVFKITKEQDEYAVAERIVNRYSDFTTFIPVYWVDGKNMYIMANAEPISGDMRGKIDAFMQDFYGFARERGGEVSIFEFANEADIDAILQNFIMALQADVEKLDIPEFELDMDFRADNVMQWNGKLVLVDW